MSFNIYISFVFTYTTVQKKSARITVLQMKILYNVIYSCDAKLSFQHQYSSLWETNSRIIW